MEEEHVISKQLVKLENQSSHESKKQEFSGEREVIEDEEIKENVETQQPTPRISTREIVLRGIPILFRLFYLLMMENLLVFRKPLIVMAMLSGIWK